MKNGSRRFKSDGNISVHKEILVIVLAYVDDVMAFGKLDEVKKVVQEGVAQVLPP